MSDKITTKWPKWVLEADSGKPLGKKIYKNKIVPMDVIEGKKKGGIRVLKLYNRFAKVDPELKKWPVIDGYDRINTCKNSGRYGDELSPMRLGPVYDENGELYGSNIEDAWQCSKVWESQLTDGADPLLYWKEWSRRGRFSGEARRHRTPGGKGNRIAPIYSYYMGDELSYGDARKRMYMKWYAELVVKTDAYKDLKARHLSGRNLLLLEYDGLHRNSDENRDLDEEFLVERMNDHSRPFGHGLVLACCLLGKHIWEYR